MTQSKHSTAWVALITLLFVSLGQAAAKTKVGDVAKELGRRWGECDPYTKQRFEQLAAQDRQRYEKEKQVSYL